MPSVELTKDNVMQTIFSALDEVNAGRNPEQQLKKHDQSILFGPEGQLESLELVGLILSVERKIAQQFGVAVTLADERAMSERNSPFRTVERLADYVTMLSREGNSG
jgi:hypothetical protein